jgi:hypothetical protein
VLKSVVRAGEAFVTVTLYDGLRLARSGFESSIAYRSVAVVGSAHEVIDETEKRRVLDLFVDRVLPGRAEEVRPSNEQELRLTLMVAVSIDEASAKVSRGPTEDDEDDQDLPVWSGTVPARVVFGDPVPDTNGAMAHGGVALGANAPGPTVNLEDLRQQIQRITPVDAREDLSIGLTLDRLNWPGDPFSESDNDHHVTASSFVISSRGVILHLHRRLGIWVQPGGHVDAGESPEEACVRETVEETGLAAHHLDPANESPDVFWFDFDAAIERAEPSLAAALKKLAEASVGFGVTD